MRVCASASTRTAASQTLIGSGSWPTSKATLLVGLGIGEALDELGDQGVEIGRLLPHLAQQRLGRGQVRALKWSRAIDLRTRRARLLVARPERLDHGTVVEALGPLARRTAQTAWRLASTIVVVSPKPREMKLSSTTASRRVLRGDEQRDLDRPAARRELDPGLDVPEVGFLAGEDREAQRQGLVQE